MLSIKVVTSPTRDCVCMCMVYQYCKCMLICPSLVGRYIQWAQPCYTVPHHEYGLNHAIQCIQCLTTSMGSTMLYSAYSASPRAWAQPCYTVHTVPHHEHGLNHAIQCIQCLTTSMGSTMLYSAYSASPRAWAQPCYTVHTVAHCYVSQWEVSSI